jgi:plastocyanin
MSKIQINAVASALLVGFAVSLATPATAQDQSMKRMFTVAAVEPKGGVTVDKEPFPTAALPAGGGYVLNKPDTNGRWEISAYMWMPSQLIVRQGDDVTLEFVGINGANHATVIKGYNQSFVVKRGQTTRINFKADKAGVFPIECANHRPSMVGELIVVARE